MIQKRYSNGLNVFTHILLAGYVVWPAHVETEMTELSCYVYIVKSNVYVTCQGAE